MPESGEIPINGMDIVQSQSTITEKPAVNTWTYQSLHEAYADLNETVMLDSYSDHHETPYSLDELFQKFRNSRDLFDKGISEGQVSTVIKYMYDAEKTKIIPGQYPLEFIQAHLPEIEEQLTERKLHYTAGEYTMLASLVTGIVETEGMDHSGALNYLDSHIADILKATIKADIEWIGEKAVKTLLVHGDAYQRGTVWQNLETLFKQSEDAKLSIELAEIISKLAGDENDNIKWPAWTLSREKIEEYGLDASAIHFAWSQSATEKNKERAFEKNFPRLVSLEAKRPGIAKVLFEEFGIANFGRYSEEVLIHQYDNRDDNNKPYGLLINAGYDHDGALYSDVKLYQKLFEDLGGEYNLRIYEANSTLDVVAVINQSSRRYETEKVELDGSKSILRGKAEFLILGGHGNQDSISIGNDDIGFYTREKTRIGSSDLKRAGSVALGDAFVDQPTIIINSCSTGQLGGIGEQISRLNAHVIAPDNTTSIRSINITKDNNNKLHFSVEFNKDVATREYRGGNLIQNEN